MQQHMQQPQPNSLYQSQLSNQLPPLKNVPGISNVMYNDDNNSRSLSMNNMNSDISVLSINNASNVNLLEQNEKLRTRISELELVNDLYKTRITELEETDMKFQNTEAKYKKQIQDLENALNLYKQQNVEYNSNAGDKRQNSSDETPTKRIKIES